MKKENSENASRKRGLTDITLGWLADKLRRTEKIKADVASGNYQINSDKVAASILNIDESHKKSD